MTINSPIPAGLKYLGMLLCILSFAQECIAARPLFRWIDEEGNVHYSDTVPPEKAKHKRESLNEQGRTINITEAAKSPEQIANERRLKKLRDMAQRLLAEQIAQDQTLLRSYRNEEELITARDAKLSMLETQKLVAGNNFSRLAEKLDALQRQAADYERNGKQVPESVLAEIGGLRSQMEESQEKEAELEHQEQALKRQFNEDLDRLRTLATMPGGALTMENENAASRPPALSGDEPAWIFPCPDEAGCAKAWKRAADYAGKFSTTPIRLHSETLIYTYPPKISSDLALSVSKQPGETEGSLLFLDVRCANNGPGIELCASPKVEEIRAGFKPFVEAGTTSASQQ